MVSVGSTYFSVYDMINSIKNRNLKKFKEIFSFSSTWYSWLFRRYFGLLNAFYAISKINQAILLIHDCVCTKDACLIRFDFIEHLNKMMDRQSQQFQAIEKAYGMDDIGDEYIFSMIRYHYFVTKPLSNINNFLVAKNVKD